MKVDIVGLNGKTYSLKLNLDKRTGSSGHELARKLIALNLPSETVYEEVTLPGTGKPSLRADFFLPKIGFLIEIHGRQHYEYVPHFHKNKHGFLASKKRDLTKRQWCELNNIMYVELPYNVTEDWGRIIASAVSTNRGNSESDRGTEDESRDSNSD